MLSLFGQRPEERRRDPEDGEFRTLRELQQTCAGKYSEQEIQHYWETQCKPIEGAESPRGNGEEPELATMHSVVNDPFMTHATPREREVDVRSNPFLTGAFLQGQNESVSVKDDPFLTGRAAASAALREDAFMTHSQAAPPHGPELSGREDNCPSSQQQALSAAYGAAVQAKKDWTEVVCRLLGPGDAGRRPSARNVLVLAPWLLYMWIVLLWLLLRHYSRDTCIALTALLFAAAAALVVTWCMGKRWGPVSLLVLGVLCLLAVGSGTCVGQLGWHRFWRQYWWLQTGARTEFNSATTPAGAQVDSVVVGFWDGDAAHTVNGTYVDDLRSAGFKDVHYYCVAPVVSPDTSEGSLVRVNYWAVGIDCCQRSGSFFCDDSRSYDGGYGVVMLDGGFPCPDCDQEKFRHAVSKAEAVHGLVSAPGALFVRWVRSPSSVEVGVLCRAVAFLLLSGSLGFLAFLTLGSAAWYYGIGTQTLFGGLIESFDEGLRQKLLA
mmetsp:Transcript_100371/g.323960  ORF Transcript_100371/g.323960 Transcript_100371/m.323960 type:complete len:493 (-) Transcript_100371:242-1720(-)